METESLFVLGGVVVDGLWFERREIFVEVLAADAVGVLLLQHVGVLRVDGYGCCYLVFCCHILLLLLLQHVLFTHVHQLLVSLSLSMGRAVNLLFITLNNAHINYWWLVPVGLISAGFFHRLTYPSLFPLA